MPLLQNGLGIATNYVWPFSHTHQACGITLLVPLAIMPGFASQMRSVCVIRHHALKAERDGTERATLDATSLAEVVTSCLSSLWFRQRVQYVG
jgi:hypothetical protein